VVAIIASRNTPRALRWLASLAILALSLALSPPAWCETSLRTEVSPSQGSTEDVFSFAVVIEGSRNAAAPKISGGSDFEVSFLGPNSFVSIINGVVTARTTYMYQLKPLHEGRLQTPAVRVTIEGRELEAPPEVVEVSKGEPRQASAPHGGAAPVFIRQSATPSSVYEGQQLVNIVDIYTSVDLADLAPLDLSADGFWQESISEGDRAQRVIDGHPYQSVQFVKALYPLASGARKLPARLLKAKAARPQGAQPPQDPYDPFASTFFDSFFRRVEFENISLKSNEITVQVRPLPPVPADLQAIIGTVPIVGATTLSVDSDVSIAQVGESKTITYHLVSEGNINPVTSLKLEAPEGVKTYEERPEMKRERKGARLLLHRIFRFSVVPLKPGLAKIPPLRVAFFDPAAGEYRIAASKEVAFAVQGQAAGDPRTAGTTSSGSSLHTALPTMPPLPFGPDLEFEERGLAERVLELFSIKSALLLLTAIIGATLIVAMALRLRPLPPPIGLAPSDLDRAGTLPELEAFMRSLVASRLPGLGERSSLDEIRARIAAEVEDADIALSLRDLFDELEVLRYGGGGTALSHDLGAIKERARRLLTQWRPRR